MTDRPKLTAPAWHTVLLIVLLLANSMASARARTLLSIPGLSADPKIAGYLTGIIVEWLLVAYIWWGVRLRGGSLADLIGGAWPRWRAVPRDIGIAIAFLIVANIVYATMAKLLHVDPGAMLKSIFPRTSGEVTVYLILSITAGFTEELIFRGYLLRQFTAFTKSIAAGLVLQGVLFGLSHGYQGPRLMLIVTIYGCLFGLLAVWRHSLRPGMIAHGLQDSVIAIVMRAVTR